jgi:serine kinase of HPr protein (carbohydrate metabolism regulator)
MTRRDYMHATGIIWKHVGILLVGEAASGKSSLAAEMITRGAILVGDDQLLLSEEDGKIFADAPPALAGVLELRDVGLIRMPYTARAQMHVVVECGDHAVEPKTIELMHVVLPRIVLQAEHAISAAKLILYAEALHEGRVLPEDWKPEV